MSKGWKYIVASSAIALLIMKPCLGTVENFANLRQEAYSV